MSAAITVPRALIRTGSMCDGTGRFSSALSRFATPFAARRVADQASTINANNTQTIVATGNGNVFAAPHQTLPG
jgi:hypothetical protein